MDIDKSHLPFFSKRLNKFEYGNEGAGKVIETGKDSKHLLGKIVSVSVEVIHNTNALIP